MNKLTIEQLAAESGMTVRNIRAHQSRGLLPPPEVRERVGFYGSDHLARLELIRELQAEGFNLQGIKRLLEQAAPEALLRAKHAITAPFETQQANVFTLAELAERFGGPDPSALAKAESLGLLVPVGGDRYEAPVPSLIDVAQEVHSRGVPIAHALATIAKIHERCEAISRQFVRLFLDDVWKPFAAAGYPEGQWDEVLETVDRLRPIASEAVLAVFQMTMSEEVERAFGKEIARLTGQRR